MNLMAGLILAPLLLGVIHRTKAIFAGRRGQSLFQVYFDLWKLLGKGAVYSQSTTWVFKVGPMVGLASVLLVLLLIPFGGQPAVWSFSGDLVFLAYLLGLMRLFTVLAAMDTGSSFEAMGASREVTFSALAEPALLLGFAAIVHATGHLSVSGMLERVTAASWTQTPAPLALVCISFFVVFLAENARMPVDDPTTHLELTMIHEVMVLDHSGPDLAFIHYAASLKLWAMGTLLVGLICPAIGYGPWVDLCVALAGIFVLAVVVGVAESCMARLRLLVVPRLLLGAVGLSLIALLLVVWL